MLVASDSGDPVDMLDTRKAAHAPKGVAPVRQRAEGGDFARNSEGRMIFREEEVKKGVQGVVQHAPPSTLADGLQPLHSAQLMQYAKWRPSGTGEAVCLLV